MALAALRLLPGSRLLSYLPRYGKLKVSTGNVKDSAFIFAKFSNWKDVTVAFASQEKSATHKRASQMRSHKASQSRPMPHPLITPPSRNGLKLLPMVRL